MKLSEKKREALRAFKRLEQPSLTEWAEEMQVSYPVAVWYRDELTKAGCMEWTRDRARSTRLTAKGRRAR